MEAIRKWFLVLMLIGPLHMAEQRLTSIEEFHAIRRALAVCYAWFSSEATSPSTESLPLREGGVA